jgi:hypothetical protein
MTVYCQHRKCNELVVGPNAVMGSINLPQKACLLLNIHANRVTDESTSNKGYSMKAILVNLPSIPVLNDSLRYGHLGKRLVFQLDSWNKDTADLNGKTYTLMGLIVADR